MSSTRKHIPKLPSIIESGSAENENGDIFEGEFHPNNKPKYGKLIYKNGSYFNGSFDENGNCLNGSVFVPFVNDNGNKSQYIKTKYKDGVATDTNYGGTKRAKLKRTKRRRSTKNTRRKH
jgi:hypothetical protein